MSGASVEAEIDIKAELARNAREVDVVLDQLLPLRPDPEARLMEAIRYATLSGGKRIRPFLVMASSEQFSVSRSLALRVAAAIEMVHCYSLIHDDLPAMDDDDLRRGLPTCHVKFDEATAILAGDALLARAFEVLADPATHPDPRVRSDLVCELAKAAGGDGMVGGQMLDLLAAETPLEIPEITRMQRMKTGALIAFSCESAAVLAKAPDSARHALHAYAHDLGLAFQIADDLLDAEGDPSVVGKRTQKDEDAGKATFVSLLGVDRARAQSRMLAQQAVEHLSLFPQTADPLRALAWYVVDRRN
ncbi:MAG: farnesyl diphosphate synthase [Rhodospirillales bacterium]